MEWVKESGEKLEHYYTPDKEWCFIKREDGVFLVYKLEIYDYSYQGVKLYSLDECEEYVNDHP